jgi:hypothetical protein
MYTTQIITYLIWPLFILLSWIIIRSAVILYEKRNEEGSEKTGEQ